MHNSLYNSNYLKSVTNPLHASIPEFAISDLSSIGASSKKKATPKTYSIPTKSQKKPSQNSILSLLEEERAKFVTLQSAYESLIGQLSSVEAAQETNLKSKLYPYVHEINRLEKTIADLKNDLERKNQEMSDLVLDVKALAERCRAADSKLRDSERFLATEKTKNDDLSEKLGDLLNSFELLKDKLRSRELELKNLIPVVHSKDEQLDVEKEEHKKTEGKLLQLERLLRTREAEFNEKQNRFFQLQSDFEMMKRSAEEAEKKLKQFEKREKLFLEEIEGLHSKEQRLHADIHEKNLQIEEIETSKNANINLMLDTEARLRNELSLSFDVIKRQVEDLKNVQGNMNIIQRENSILLNENKSLKSKVSDLNRDSEISSRNASIAKESESQLRSELQNKLAVLDESHHEISRLQNQVSDLKEKISYEVQVKNDMERQYKDRVLSITEKITVLQNALSETQDKINFCKDTETSLRANIRQRDEVISKLQAKISEYERNIADLNMKIEENISALELLKSSKKEELLVIQEKFVTAKESMENDVNSLKIQVSSKAAQVNHQSEEISKLQSQLSHFKAERFRLESRISELETLESNQSRKISNLSQTLREREEQLNSKSQQFFEKIKGLEEELLFSKKSNPVSRKYSEATTSYSDKDDVKRSPKNISLSRANSRGIDILDNINSYAEFLERRPISPGFNIVGYDDFDRQITNLNVSSRSRSPSNY